MSVAAVNDRVVIDARSAVAAEVRALMGRHRVNQKQLAQALECSQAAVSRRLSGDVAFDVDELTRIAGLFETTLVELVSGARLRCFAVLPPAPGQDELPGMSGIDPPTLMAV